MSDRSVALSNEGHLLMQVHQYNLALAKFDAALAISPRYALAQANRACALANLGRMVEARESMEQALSSDPTRPDVLYAAGWLLAREGRHADAVRYYDRSIDAYQRELPAPSCLTRSFIQKAASLMSLGDKR